MASTDSSTSSSHPSTLVPDEHKRTIDEAFLNKLKLLVERVRLENATLKKSLDIERSEVRAMKAKHEAELRNLKSMHSKKEESLERQLRTNKSERKNSSQGNERTAEIRKLTLELQTYKSANKRLQESLKVAQASESARAAELRAQAAKHAALETAARKDARAQCHKLLEEIKSKERMILQLKRDAGRTTATQHTEQVQRMEAGVTELSKRIRIDQDKDKTNREDLKTDIQHRKETFYREPQSDEDSAMSSAPTSLSPQPLSDMWACAQCRLWSDRASAAAREAARLTDALRDARDQLELMEFRILELEDARCEKGNREMLTDSDSGCVSPGSRIKDSASPELKRMDSGYKSPHLPSSPLNPRRALGTPHDDFKEDLAKAQVLADILDKNSETSDSMKSNPVKEHLEQMILNAASAEDRTCLEQVLMLLYNLQTLSSSVSEEEFYQAKPKRLNDKSKSEVEIPSLKTHKAIATVTPYQQKGYKCDSLESLCEERKPNILQESGIFEGAETESIGTQTDVNDSFDAGELNTEIQRLNSIREKLERQGVRNRTLANESEALECRCVKLGKRHKQYYERRLKFLEGKISIYEAAPDVKEAKLQQRLQKEFLLENRIQELEEQITELRDKYERLEEECCELEEIENDTRLHWQQLEMDYELCSAQLRDMTEQRESSRAHAQKLLAELEAKERQMRSKESELSNRLSKLEKAVPAIIAYNVIQAVGAEVTPNKERQLLCRMGPYRGDKSMVASQLMKERQTNARICQELVAFGQSDDTPNVQGLERKVRQLLEEKKSIEKQSGELTRKLQTRIRELESDLETARRQLAAAECLAAAKAGRVDDRIRQIEGRIRAEKETQNLPVEPDTLAKIEAFKNIERDLKTKLADLEKREAAYLEMLSQADDMWAEMEAAYKKKIAEAAGKEVVLVGRCEELQKERDYLKHCFEPLQKKIKEMEEAETGMRVALEKSERDKKQLKFTNSNLVERCSAFEDDARRIAQMEKELKESSAKFRDEIMNLRRLNDCLKEDLKTTKETAKQKEKALTNEVSVIKKEIIRVQKTNSELDCGVCELREEVESLEKQLSLTQKALNQCKRKCEDKINSLTHELSIKTEELEELRSETMRKSYHASRIELKPDRTEYVDEGYSIYTAVPKKHDYGRMHHSLSYITNNSQCTCPAMRNQLVSQLIDDLFERVHNTVDDDLTKLCKELENEVNEETKAKITNFLLMAISKELVRSIGDADAKTDTEEWQRCVRAGAAGGGGNAGVVAGAARLASVACACAAAALCAARPALHAHVHHCQQEVLEHGDVKIMEEQLANAIESIVNCPSCALGTNAIVWSTDV